MAEVSLTVKDTRAEVCGKTDKDTPVILRQIIFAGFLLRFRPKNCFWLDCDKILVKIFRHEGR